LDFWNKLSKADRKIITEASEQAGNYETELMEQQLKDVYAFLKTKMTVIENPDVASMRKAIEDAGIFTERAANWPPGMLDYIKNAK
jgi:TRAP-type C4-dicarboxylate transport system substrate-binding protein